MEHLLDALMPRVRQSVLAATYLEPERRWYQSELARRLGTSPSSLQRELASLTGAGILSRHEEGGRILYQANPACPFGCELRSMLTKTVGVVEPLREALRPLQDRVRVAFVYGSFARGEQHAGSDIDLMVVGEVGLFDVSAAIKGVERQIGFPVNPTVYRAEEFTRRVQEGSHFLTSVMGAPKLLVRGSEDELEAVAGREAGAAARHDEDGTG